jgi:hypothetical protein
MLQIQKTWFAEIRRNSVLMLMAMQHSVTAPAAVSASRTKAILPGLSASTEQGSDTAMRYKRRITFRLRMIRLSYSYALGRSPEVIQKADLQCSLCVTQAKVATSRKCQQ